jgi:hypothetical protein
VLVSPVLLGEGLGLVEVVGLEVEVWVLVALDDVLVAVLRDADLAGHSMLLVCDPSGPAGERLPRMAKTPSLPSASELSDYSGPEHPLVSAMQFGELLRNTGGATMNVHTNKVYEAGKSEGYSVGGSDDERSGDRVETKRLPFVRTEGQRKKVADMSPASVLSERDRIRATGRQDAGRNVGAWNAEQSDYKPRRQVDIDASDILTDRSAAVALGAKRGEDAIFDLKNGTDIQTKF